MNSLPGHSSAREHGRMVMVLASVAALLLASVLVALHSEAQFKADATTSAQAQARVLAETATAALAFDDRAALNDYVRALAAGDQVDAVGVYDGNGRLVASFSRTHLASSLEQTLRAGEAPDRVIVTAPVVQKGQRLGTVYLRDRTEPLGRRVIRYAGAALLVLMALMMFAVMALDARALRRANRSLMSTMAEREKAEAALRQSQKMEAVGRLTGGIAHDFNNMLAVTIGCLDLLLRRHLTEELPSAALARNALDGANRAAALTRRLLAFSRLQPLKPAVVDIARCVNDMADLLRRTLGETIAIEAVSAGGLWRAHIDRSQLKSAIVNLAINARDAMPNGGKLTIEASNTYLDKAYIAGEPDVAPGQYVLLAVTDTGQGIPPEILGQVFEPFFTTKPAGAGTGLGLSQVQGFIKQSGGHIRIYSEPGVGTNIKLYMPRSTAEPPDGEAVPARPRASPPRNLTVLVVEDDPGVREFTCAALSELGFDVLAASGAEPALRLLDSHLETALLLTDVVMPEINGRDLAEAARRRAPGLKVVFMTGYTRNAIVHNGVLDANTHLLSKPFTITQLAAELDAALAADTNAVGKPGCNGS